MDFSDSIQLLSELNGQIIDLWVWFVAGNFAALAAYFSVERMIKHVKWLFLIGFITYASGNLILIKDNLIVIDKLKSEIVCAKPEYFKKNAVATESAKRYAKVNHPWYIAVIFHVLVDICIILIVLFYSKPSARVPSRTVET